MASGVISLAFKGKTEQVDVQDDTMTDVLFEAASVLAAGAEATKLIFKGKQLVPGQRISESALHGAKAAKVMVMATGAQAVAAVVAARSDPTVRGFAMEDEEAKRRKEEDAEELSEWAQPQHPEYKFCRLEMCTWQSFGTRPTAKTPHAFAARQLLLKLAQDPAIRQIMEARKWTVGVLAEMDPLDDRLAEKMEGGGKRLLGYNMNAGGQIHLRLRSHDLSGFLPYTALIDTLLHELSHNAHGPHDEQFWHLFCQLKADYLRYHLQLASSGRLFGGKSPLTLADAADQARDVRLATLLALERDRQMGPPGPLQTGLLDAYLAATTAAFGGGHGGGGEGKGGLRSTDGNVVGGGPPSADAAQGQLSREELRRRAADAAAARAAGHARPSAEADEGGASGSAQDGRE